MSPITVFFAAGDELPHATANTAEITKRANSCPNVRFISMPLPASFNSLLQSVFLAPANGLALGRIDRQVVLRLPMPGICQLLRASGRIAVEAPGACGLSR